MIGFDKLNDMQKKAVLQTEGPVLILAGAGSGKTGALTVRIANLIKNNIKPYNILAITFTNKAAKEMKERVNGLIGEEAKDILISTFHSTCVRILRSDIEKIGYGKNFTIYDTSDQEKVLKDIFKQMNISTADKTISVKGVKNIIGRLKDELISPEEYYKTTGNDVLKQQVAEIYRRYQEALKKNNALDFDDLIYKTVLLFRNEKDVLEKYRERYRYILIDEYQDTNTAQYEFVKLLASKYNNLCVVGDDDQSIYGFRGANIQNILDFEKDFENCTVIKLEQNYRSTKTILDVANAVISNNNKRKSKTLWTENDSGSSVHSLGFENEFLEAKFVSEKISELTKENQRKYSDFAVLYRTNAQSRTFEDQFIKVGIPYRLLGGIRFYERKEIRDIIAYLRTILNPDDYISLNRIINVPKRGIGDTSINKVLEYADENGISFFDALKDVESIKELKARAKKFTSFYETISNFIAMKDVLSIKDLICDILNKTGYLNELKEEGTLEAEGRIENLDEFISKAEQYQIENPEATLETFMEEISLVSDVDNYDENQDAVVLMTLHSSKGLEFPVVFMVGMEEGVFPSYRSIDSGSEKEIEEERRLCYVGITRAREELYLTNAKTRMQRGITHYCNPSRFIEEIPSDLIEKPVKVVRQQEKFKSPKTLAKMGTFSPKPSPYGMVGKLKDAVNSSVSEPSDFKLDFSVGDSVRAPKYGIGTVKNINPAGADFEVTVSFAGKGDKKFMAKLSKLKKVTP